MGKVERDYELEFVWIPWTITGKLKFMDMNPVKDRLPSSGRHSHHLRIRGSTIPEPMLTTGDGAATKITPIRQAGRHYRCGQIDDAPANSSLRDIDAR